MWVSKGRRDLEKRKHTIRSAKELKEKRKKIKDNAYISRYLHLGDLESHRTSDSTRGAKV